MLTKIFSATPIGIGAALIEVEVDVSSGLPTVVVVGLPDAAVKEARERVRSAIRNSGGVFPASRVAINLAPADLPKVGTQFDLPIAISILVNSGQLQAELADTVIVGELALDGGVRSVPGVLPAAMAARDRGCRRLIIPEHNSREASLVRGIEAIPVASLSEAVAYLQKLKEIAPAPPADLPALLIHHQPEIDFADVRGQEYAKRALEIAAAGGHNVLMVGPPGSGKTMLARAFPGILPTLSEEEMLEVTKIYSVAGLLDASRPVVTARPFRSPHHSASAVALVGGGSVPRPGEISLAHRGVLFLDELPEFGLSVLESLRQPLEDGVVTVSRATGTVTFPANFTLLASQNPCPCGYRGDPVKPCQCALGAIQRYRKKISGPLLDRIDLALEVPRVTYEKIVSEQPGEKSSDIRSRVEAARRRQRDRFSGTSAIQCNADMSVRDIRTFCLIDSPGQELLRSAVVTKHLSTRSYYRIIRVARTIADLSDSADILQGHVAEALHYRLREDEP